MRFATRDSRGQCKYCGATIYFKFNEDRGKWWIYNDEACTEGHNCRMVSGPVEPRTLPSPELTVSLTRTQAKQLANMIKKQHGVSTSEMLLSLGQLLQKLENAQDASTIIPQRNPKLLHGDDDADDRYPDEDDDNPF